jgi:hypothetical protein
MGLIGMMLVLYNIGDENKEHDHDDGYIVGSSMHDINPRKFKRNEAEIRYIEWVCESYLSLETHIPTYYSTARACNNIDKHELDKLHKRLIINYLLSLFFSLI